VNVKTDEYAVSNERHQPFWKLKEGCERHVPRPKREKGVKERVRGGCTIWETPAPRSGHREGELIVMHRSKEEEAARGGENRKDRGEPKKSVIPLLEFLP